MFIHKDETLIAYFRKKLINWEKDNYAQFPWRNCNNKWHSLAVEIMLQRTKAEQVLPVFIDFCKKYPTPDKYNEKSNIFNSLGLQQRNKEFKALAKILSNKDIPETKEELVKLPGVGEYVACAYLSLHQNKRAVIIDSNVVRLYGRFFGFETDGETRRKKWFINLSEELTPKRNFYLYNYSLLDFPRLICTQKANCKQCMLNKKCKYAKNNKN